ncbi:hypothetical protein [Streptomyces sp. NPDC007355]|uniref:hypothetical protein n=1 Tax=Streptomyces sp. NPDC007355 TaxID=3364778 RepID=UPI003673C814
MRAAQARQQDPRRLIGAPQAATSDVLRSTRAENVRCPLVPFGEAGEFGFLSGLPGNTGVGAVGSDPPALSNAELYNRLVSGLP